MATIGDFLRGLFRPKVQALPPTPTPPLPTTDPAVYLDNRLTDTPALRPEIAEILRQGEADIRQGMEQAVRKGLEPELRKPAYEPAPDPLKDEIKAELANPSARNFVLSGEWQKMTSTNVDQIRYFFHDRQLDVRFNNGGEYTYFTVPWEVAAAFSLADSPGRFVWNYLRDVYPFRRVKRGTKRTKPYPRGFSLRALNREDIESGRKTREEVQEESRIFSRRRLGLPER